MKSIVIHAFVVPEDTMAAAEKRTFTLPREQVEYIDRLVASGNYADGNEVIRAGLDALEDRGEEIERWLREEVVPVVDKMRAHPERGLTIEQAFGEIRKRHGAGKAGGGV